MRELLAAREWHATSLGPPERWTPVLSGAVRICVNATSPSLVAWGREAALIYNRAAHALLGDRHPRALGLPAGQSRLELWDALAPSAVQVLNRGEPRIEHERLLLLERDGFPEEGYFDVLMMPVLDGRDIAGVLCTLSDATSRVRSRRRLAMLGDLALRCAAADSDQQVWSAALAALQRNPADLPFALLYRMDEGETAATLAGAIGLAPGDDRAPERIGADTQGAPWPLARVARTREPLLWTDAVIEPLIHAGGPPCGFLVAGVNPRQPLDDAYRDFIHTTAARLAAFLGHTGVMERNRARAESLERGRAKLERRCSELMRLFQQAPIPILVVRGPDFVIESMNAESQAAIAPRRVLGRPLFEAVAELQGLGFDERLRRVVATGEPDVGTEVPVRLELNGHLETRYFTFISAPMNDGESAERSGVIIVANDVTPMIKARQALEQSELRYRDIFDSVDVSIWEEDFSRVVPLLDELRAAGVGDLREYCAKHPDFVRRALRLVRVNDMNGATLRLFGAHEKAQLSRSLPTILMPESLRAFAEKLVAIHERRRVVRTDTVARTLQGERLELMMTVARPSRSRDEHTVLVTLTDITDHKRLEQALREADRQKDEFLATLAHELRNPLAPLRSTLDLLRRSPGDMPGAVLDIIERQVGHLARLADDLFESSRIRRGTFDLRKERVLLWDVLRNALETSGPLLRGAGHKLEVSVPDEPIWLDGDPTRLAQVFSNLLNNASRYTRPAGQVSVRARIDGDFAEIAVADTGIGLTAESLPKLFAMFSRVGRGDDSSNGGLGIGLALAKQLVGVHGGTIGAFSDGPGKGSTFTVRLPIAEVADAEEEPVVAAAASVTHQRILVVDDNQDAAASLQMLLEAHGAEARVADSGPRALAAFASFAPDVVLLDIGMPGMNGYEVARRLRTEFAERPVTLVALTGWGRQEDIRRAEEAGFDHHLVKPVDIGALLALLARLDQGSGGNGS